MSETPETPGMPLMRAGLVWDLVVKQDVPEMLRLLGMTPPGPDGVEIAAADSRRRADLVKPIGPALDLLATEISDIYIRAMLGEAAKELDEELVDDLTSTYGDFLAAGLKVGLANLMAAGILTYHARA